MIQTDWAQWLGGFFDGDGTCELAVEQNDNVGIKFQARPNAIIGHSYVGGLLDADGTVGVRIAQDSSIDGHRAQPDVQIAQSENDELISVLNGYADKIGINSSIRHHEQEEGWADTFDWCVCGVRDVDRLLDSIRHHTVVKRRQIDILCDEILPLIKQNEHLNRRGFLKLMAWRDVLNSHKGGTRGKYNLPYFEEIWSMRLSDEFLPSCYPGRGRLHTIGGGGR